MPVWGYFVIGFVILALVLLTFRRNVPVVHGASAGYGDDFRRVLDDVIPAVEEMTEAVREGQERPIATAASRARSHIKHAIDEVDRLNMPETLPSEQRELIETLAVRLRQAMENYEWAARIAETTDLVENAGLRRGFDSLVAAGDQLAVSSRLELVALGTAAEGAGQET
ncbi:MAG TPA: hypothetical protein VG329_09160 [Candidatus Dormibacteraeota bacterium]|jgi:hypothetical protein|nr:hypothetical protein [Candidatus Dormibacteraeota bacterium]